ncbi:DUF1963 domain-containing protein [Ideonella sp.]|uniref:DUF1963 domain-containing protein n=1 Tax=Ideonella sp. TaxID=1929293 RepID=UPI003BB71B92
MPLHQKIEFFEDSPINGESKTKFGGQPDWITTAQWPLSRTTGNPMRFLCQIELDERIFPAAAGKMAYVFMTDENEYIDGTWEPDGGENCVVIQPSSAPLVVKVANLLTGPSLYTMREAAGSNRLVPVEQAYGTQLSVGEDPSYQPTSAWHDWSDEQVDAYASELEGNKIGGTPIFLQDDEFPSEEPWRLLLQLDSTRVPFLVNFGDAGVAYAFIDPEGSKGRMLWQCA